MFVMSLNLHPTHTNNLFNFDFAKLVDCIVICKLKRKKN